MMRKFSPNRKVLNNLLKKGRAKDTPSNAKYHILYAFLYKYLSDRLKNHLLHCLGGDREDLNIYYLTDEGFYELRDWAFDELGYFITSKSAYMDEFIKDCFVDDIFRPDFFTILKDNIIFAAGNPAEDYFKQIIEIMERRGEFYGSRYDEEFHAFMSNYLFSLSKFDIAERCFTYAQVYDAIASSRQIRVATTPEYISSIISAIVKSQRHSFENAYDPFMKDASILFELNDDFNRTNLYGKEDNELYYFYSLIKAFINEVDFSRLSLYRENAIKSMAVDSQMFDVIASKVPSTLRRMSLKSQSLEVPGENKAADLKETLLSSIDMEKLSGDDEAVRAFKVLEEKIAEIEKSEAITFSGEYKSLAESEFLFLINMINSLKDDGMMVVSLSQNFLFKQSLETLRKFLTYENNYIDAIISLPEMGRGAVRPEVIIIFKKDRNMDNIVFIDLSKKYELERSKNTVPGLFRNNLVLDDATTARIVEVLNRRMCVEQFSEIVTIRDLERNDFNLTVSRYVDTYDGDFIRLDDLKKENEEIEKKMRELNAKIDRLLGELNLK